MERVKPSDEIKFSLGGDVAEGCAFMIANGFVHRDLAARNVLISSDCKAKVGDFGLSKETREDRDYYVSKGGAAAVRWGAPEALNFNRYSTVVIHSSLSESSS